MIMKQIIKLFCSKMQATVTYKSYLNTKMYLK